MKLMCFWPSIICGVAPSWWTLSTQSPECKRTFHLHLKNSSLYTLWDLLLSGTTSLSFCRPLLSLSPSLSLWPGVNLSFLLPADSCAWLSGSLFMRSLHLSPAAASVTPPSCRPLFFLSLSLSQWKRLWCGFSSARRFTVLLEVASAQVCVISCQTSDLYVTVTMSLLHHELHQHVSGAVNVFFTLHGSLHLHKHPLVSFIPKAFF